MSRINLGIDEKKVVSVSGGRFYYESGSGKIRVKTIGSNTGEFDLSPGMGFQNTDDMKNFIAVEITNISSVAIVIDFVISYREVFDNRVTFSNGSEALLVDGATSGKVFTERGDSHLLTNGNGAVAAKYSQIALRNTVDATKKIVVRRVTVSSSIVCNPILMGTPNFLDDVATGDGGLTGYSAGVPQVGTNKLLVGASFLSVGAISKYQSTIFQFGDQNQLARLNLAANTPYDFIFSEPIVIYPGAALIVNPGIVNCDLSVCFEVFQEVL